MKKALFMTTCFVNTISLSCAFAQTTLRTPGEQSRKFPPAMLGQPIAGIPYDEAMKIFERHVVELGQLPGSEGVGIMGEGLVVTTTNPAALPSSVEGLPVFSVLPSRLQQSPPEAPTISLKSVLPSEHPEGEEIPLRTDCPVGMHGVPGSVWCAFDTLPADDGPKVKFNPPPSGVVVLKPGGLQEQADSCPQGLQEVEGYNNWRFCVDPQKPERIPNLWLPPIAGVPYEKALEIHHRHIDELSKLPGVEGVELGAEGINVYTTQPDYIPKQVEGLRVIPRPVPPGDRGANSHTYNTSVRPLHGLVVALQGAHTSVRPY